LVRSSGFYGGKPMTSQSDFGAAFEAHLEHVGEEGKAINLSVNEMVRLCLPQIRRAKRQKFTWDAIATCIQATVQQIYGQEVSIAPSTARRTYYKLTQKKKQPDSTTTDSNPRSRSTATTSRKSSTPANTMTSTQAVQPAAPVVTPAPEPVARSPAAEPEPELTSNPVEVAPPKEPSQPRAKPKAKNKKSEFNVPPGITIPIA
jgi:hypothetical protein